MMLLLLNDMRTAHYERLTPAAWGETEAELIALMERERVPTYQTEKAFGGGSWGKTFRQGGPLEWFNQPRTIVSTIRPEHFYYVATPEEAAAEQRTKRERMVQELPKA